MTEPNDNKICNGLPMGLEQMRDFLQMSHGVPVVLRKEGATNVKCVYCGKIHNHDGPPGHYVAECEEPERFNIGIVIGDRTYIPNYGYTIFDYRQNGKAIEESCL
jgi:hypothetical protein